MTEDHAHDHRPSNGRRNVNLLGIGFIVSLVTFVILAALVTTTVLDRFDRLDHFFARSDCARVIRDDQDQVRAERDNAKATVIDLIALASTKPIDERQAFLDEFVAPEEAVLAKAEADVEALPNYVEQVNQRCPSTG